ncbi:SPA1-related 3 isoform 3 [Melia azedarach]|uniref:SPA1-related 3 isoform 3 n=1 Tax=Melia azedarach TaxID=155640 RepID=A0ACC1Y5W3_MELAZ|nr:SPA1-related 3 isoform 3 [Melia azedarach]
MEVKDLSSPLPLDMLQWKSRMRNENLELMTTTENVLSDSYMQSSSFYGTHAISVEECKKIKLLVLLLSRASDIYQLGVLFELFCPFSSTEEKTRAMSSLRQQVLPPQLVLKFPQAASSCLW